MSPDPQTCYQQATHWISLFNQSLKTNGAHQVNGASLFLADSFWRDALALSWQLDTIIGGQTITRAIHDQAAKTGLTAISLDEDATPPQWVSRAGTDAIEAFIKFETKDANGRGIIRLCEIKDKIDINAAGPQWRAWTFFTAIDSLKGHEEQTGRNRPTGSSYSRDFQGPNWLDKRILA